MLLFAFSASGASAAVLEVTTDGTDTGDCQADPCLTIPYAVAQAADGDTVQVGPGEFTASVTADRIIVGKAVTIAGAQAGVDARDRDVPSSEETVIVGGNYSGGAIRLSAPGATVDGVTVRAHEHAAIQGMITSGGYAVRNSILTDNDTGLDLETSAADVSPTFIERNRFESNNRPGLQSGIYGDGPMEQTTIRDNLFTGHENVPINISGATTMQHDLAIVGNTFVNERHLLLLGAEGVDVFSNTFENGRTRPISVEGGVSDLTIEGNVIDGAVDAGILFTSRYGAGTNSDATIIDNSISGVTGGSAGTPLDSGAAVALAAESQGPGYSGTLLVERNRLVDNAGGGIQNGLDEATVEAPNNWWGCNGGPGTAGCDAVTGDVDPSPNVVLTIRATPERLTAGASADVTATLDRNSAGQPVSLPVLEGRGLSFEASHGSVTPASGIVTRGAVTARYSAATAAGAATVAAAFDGEIEGAGLFVGSGPVVSSAVLTGSGTVGEPLTCDGQVNGLPEPTRSTSWLRDGAPIAGETSGVYTPASGDSGSTIVCRVTAANEFGSASADSSPVTVSDRPKPPPVKPPVVKPKTRVKVSGNGRVVVLAVRCPDGTCRIKAPKRVKVKIKGKVYVVRVKAPGKVGEGKTARVRLVLPPRARKAIRGTKARARVKVVVTSSSGKRRVVNRTYVLRGRSKR